MSKRTLFVASIIVATILIGGWGEKRPPLPRPDMFKELNLTKAQEQQLEAGRKAQMAKVKRSMEHIRTLHGTLDQEFIKDAPNEARINALITEIKTEQQVLMNEHFESLLSLRKVLTPEQFKKMVIMRKEFQKKVRHGEHGDRRQGPPPKDMPEGGDDAQPPLIP